MLLGACFSPAKDKARLNEVKQIWAAFPIFPGMVEVNTFEASGFGKAFISKQFKSNASYADVRQFYVDRLTKTGWELARERNLKDWTEDLGGRQLTFSKREHEITIEFAGERAEKGWEYGIGIGWRNPRERTQ
jgi:hypothetical protein